MVRVLVVVFALCSGSAALAQPDAVPSNSIDVFQWGTVLDITAYSLGVTSCNVGDVPVSWIANDNQHPVVAQNIYRIRDGLVEQIGLSWVLHGFCALNEGGCGTCQPTNCTSLGVGCATTNSSAITGSQTNLGARSDINASTGAFKFPFPALGQTGDAIFKRIQIRNDDLDPALNPGVAYFGVIQLVTADEPAFGTHLNNEAYRRILVGSMSGGGFALNYTGSMLPGDPIQAWADEVPGVDRVAIDTPEVEGAGQLIVGTRVVDLGGGLYRYQYAIHNGTSDRSARALSIPVDPGVQVSNLTFHDVDYHSGEPYSGDEWVIEVGAASVVFRTETFGQNPNANAIRWGTTYSFSFDATSAPLDATGVIGLFKPGSGDGVSFSTKAPGSGGFLFSRGDCNVDGGTDVSDPIFLLGVLFQPGQDFPRCRDACDMNDDGFINIADAVYVLEALFAMGNPPPPPHPGCGLDPTMDTLDCASFMACP